LTAVGVAAAAVLPISMTLQGVFKDYTSLNAVRVSCSTRDGAQLATYLIPSGWGGGGYDGTW
jgi:hypothetical protein